MILTKKRCLFSLFDQNKAEEFAAKLIDLGWEIIATTETVKLFQANNIKVIDFSDFFKIENTYPFPPTLHPKLELALTTDGESAIDLVYVTTYPLSAGNDVGGQTILGLAAKGKKIPVFNQVDLDQVIEYLSQNNNSIPADFHQYLINKTNEKIAKHYWQLAHFDSTDNIDIVSGKKTWPLLEGENPYQIPADLYQTISDDELALPKFIQVSGKPPCFTNTADFDCILQTLCLLAEAFNCQYQKIPYIVIAAKHGNPCGLAIDWDFPELALEKALFGNPIAIFGGEVITNFKLTEKLAEQLFRSEKLKENYGRLNWSLDLIAAPDFDDGAIEILKQRQNLKLFKNESLLRPKLNSEEWSYRFVRGGFLRQPPPSYILNFTEAGFVPGAVSPEILESLIIAWAVAWSSNHGGNEVAIVRDRMLLAAGGGPATVDACQTAVQRALNNKHNLADSVFAADAFFPFTDAPEILAKAGCRFGLVPAGGKNFELVEECFAKNNVKMIYLPEQFRGFCRH